MTPDDVAVVECDRIREFIAWVDDNTRWDLVVYAVHGVSFEHDSFRVRVALERYAGMDGYLRDYYKPTSDAARGLVSEWKVARTLDGYDHDVRAALCEVAP